MKRPYRIFHLIKSLGRGGAEVLLNEGLGYADRERFDYGYGYFLPWKNAMVPSLEKSGAVVVCFQSKHFPSMLLATSKVTQFLNEWKADLVHCHLPLAGVVGRLAARSASLPVIYTEHNVMERYHPFTRRLNLLTWKMQKKVVAVSREVSESIQSHAGNSIPVMVIPNGVPIHSLSTKGEDRHRIRNQFRIPETSNVIGTVAVFRVQKDLKSWLKAARLIKNVHPDTHFLLVGDGPLMGEVKSFASEQGLSECTHFAGLQEFVPPFLSAMDVWMNSSIFEGLPLSLLEAMAMHLPVVATSVGGVPEVLEDGKTGFLVDAGNPENLAEKALKLLSDPRMRNEFGDAGRAVVEERFGMKRMMKQLEELYLSVLETDIG